MVEMNIDFSEKLTEEQLKAFEDEPVVLDPWDPMGALAR